jgi:SAM-dependent methyltransferase
LDIAPQYHLPSTVVGDASQAYPFVNSSFDAVLLPEVLEHLIQDWVALQEARRVLKDSGLLIVTVPFYSDDAPYHVRVHSPRSIRRLLAATGFTPCRTIFRGGLIRFPRLVHAIRKLLTPLQLDAAWYRLVVRFDAWWGQRSGSDRSARGVYILAKKSSTLDWRRLNVEQYESQ